MCRRSLAQAARPTGWMVPEPRSVSRACITARTTFVCRSPVDDLLITLALGREPDGHHRVTKLPRGLKCLLRGGRDVEASGGGEIQRILATPDHVTLRIASLPLRFVLGVYIQ
jgi:hypothetical protein